MPSIFRENTNLELVHWLRAAAQVLREQIHGLGVVDHVGAQAIEMFRRHRMSVLPPDRCVGERVAHDEFVARRASGMRPRFDDESAALGDLGLATPNSLFIKARRFEIMEDVLFSSRGRKNRPRYPDRRGQLDT